MKRTLYTALTALFAIVGALVAPTSGQTSDQSASDSTPITVQGCLRSERGNYILIEDKTGTIYALQNVGSKLHGFLRKEIAVTGEAKPGSVKTGVNPQKAGSNPSDTVHGVDGVPLAVKDINKDIHIVANHCKAADAQ